MIQARFFAKRYDRSLLNCGRRWYSLTDMKNLTTEEYYTPYQLKLPLEISKIAEACVCCAKIEKFSTYTAKSDGGRSVYHRSLFNWDFFTAPYGKFVNAPRKLDTAAKNRVLAHTGVARSVPFAFYYSRSLHYKRQIY